MSIHVYIYIYIYVCVGLCLCLWIDGQRKDLIFSIFDITVKLSRGSPLSILPRRPHKGLCPREPARPKVGTKKDEGRWELRVRLLQYRESDIQYARPDSQVRNGTSSGEDDDQR